MAEGLLCFVRLDDSDEIRMETVGRPVCPDDELKLLDEYDNEVPLGEIGELLVRAPIPCAATSAFLNTMYGPSHPTASTALAI